MTAADKAEDRSGSPPLEFYAFLLAAPEGEPPVRFVELDKRWKAPEHPGGRLVIGRPPLRSTRPLGAAISSALRRDFLAVSKRMRTKGARLTGFQRLAPPPGARGVSGALRDWLLSGAILQFSQDGSAETLLSLVARDAGAAVPPDRFHASGDGSAVARIRISTGTEVILRAAKAGSPTDPARVADGLELLERSGVERVPRVAGRGHTQRISWIAESRVAGDEPKSVDDHLFGQVVTFCAQLPWGGGAPEAARRELQIIARHFPRWSGSIQDLDARISPILTRLPRAARHGDLWSGNLLVQEGRLSGVVDWAAWDESAAPGTDLLHLWAAERKKGAGGELGEMWSARPWADPEWLRVTRPYWDALGIDPDAVTLDAVAVAWWASWVAQSVTRHPARARQSRWVTGNVDSVMETFE